jgi:DNA end-binding protein Ku
MPENERLGARAFWSGTITFGLVSVPVGLFPANRSSRISLRMLAPDGTPLERRYFCSKEDREVSSDEITRGYEIADGEFVVVTDEELEALEPRKSRDIDLRRFVLRESLEPIYFRRAYFLVPSGESTKAYRLLADAMEKKGRAGIATFVMRGKEYLVAILSEDGLLRAETLRFEDELRDTSQVGLPESSAKAAVVKAFEKEITRLKRERVDVEELRDDRAERLIAMAQKKKKKGKDVVEVAVDGYGEDDEGGEVIDLVEVLKKSLGGDAVRSGKQSGRKPPQRSKAKGSEHLDELSKSELYERAQKREIPGRSSMSKAELIEALEERA